MKKIILLTIGLLVFLSHFAGTIIVTNTNNSGAGSLRDQISVAANGDTIRFDPNLIAGGSATITLTSEIVFNKGLVFKGLFNSTDTLYISGGNTNRIFKIDVENAINKNLVIDSLILINGYTANDGGAFSFGFGNSLTVKNSIFKNNYAINSGGAIISFNDFSQANITITNSTFDNNSAGSYGGSIYSVSVTTPTLLEIVNTTMVNNNAVFDGGAIYSYSNNTEILLTNTTIANNNAPNGAGIYVSSGSPSTLTIKGCIVHNGANNINLNGTTTISSQGYNIFSNSPIGVTATDKTNITASQLNLGALQNNGGSTTTSLPLNCSVAINAGDPADASNSQNGLICGIRDIGAAENCNGLTPTSSTINPTSCNPYISPSGKNFTTSNTYMDTIPNANGCDSVITINLTIDNVNTALSNSGDLLTAAEPGATYQWVNCPSYSIISGATGQSYTATENGNYAVIITKNGCTDTSDCRYAGPHLGLDLAGSGNKVKTNYILNPTNGFTVEYDMYMHNIQNYNAGLTSTCGNKPSPLDFYINAAGVASLVTGNCSTFTSSNQAGGFVANQWYHIAIAHDKPSNKTYLYVDGIKRDSVTRVLTMDTTGLILGDRKDNVTNAEAKFDNVRVWSLTRTPQEILNNKSACLSGTETGLDVFYKMEEGSGLVINDLALSNGAQNGNITGVVKWDSGTRNVNTSSITASGCLEYTSPSGKNYTTTGIYMDTIPSAFGCDSIITIDLTINPLPIITMQSSNVISCGDSSVLFYVNSPGVNTYDWYYDYTPQPGFPGLIDGNYTEINYDTDSMTIQSIESGGYHDYYVYCVITNTSTGCSVTSANDSITINDPASGTDVQVACDSYTWPLNGMTYTASTNSPTFNISGGAENGCDSLVTLDLTINQSTTGIDVQVACNSYTWPLNGMTYTSSTNSPTFNISGGAMNGCDSLVTLNLTINQSATGIDTQEACISYTWPLNGMTYTSTTNSPTFNFVGGAVNGCDSLVTLDLTINQPTSGLDVQMACQSYTWPLNGMTYTSSTNSPTYNISGGSSNGCDSLVTLNLTINQPTTGTDIQMACQSYTWPLNGMTYTSSTNSPTFNISGGSSNGCDSLVTLDLTIGSFVTGIDTQFSCEAYTWSLNGITYNSSTNTPTFTINGGAVGGCDSVVTLNLTINTIDITTSLSGESISANNTNATYQWIDCDNGNAPINGATGQSYTATWNSNYAVIVTENGCSDTSNCVSVQSSSISNLSFDLVSIHPNPVNSLLFIEIGTDNQAYNMTITGLDGKQMMRKLNLTDKNLNIDLSDYASGVYFINLENGSDNKTIRIIKQ